MVKFTHTRILTAVGICAATANVAGAPDDERLIFHTHSRITHAR
jgi:hypothetical protein